MVQRRQINQCKVVQSLQRRVKQSDSRGGGPEAWDGQTDGDPTVSAWTDQMRTFPVCQ